MKTELQIGLTPITCQHTDFAYGYQAGHERFTFHYKGQPIADLQAYSFIFSNIMSVAHSNAYNAGYVLGWSAALHGNSSLSIMDQLMGGLNHASELS
ncbi:MAG TPA: hypothetical protein VKR06_03405 [Ktedonosporobacter sp.]|nr:hypothetical protein [Ktedonosporobacter sp.]